MDLVKSQPELTSQLPEARFVLTPPQVEILRAVLPSLEHSPPPSVCGHITVHCESSFAVGIDGVRATCSGAGFVIVGAVSVSCQKSGAELDDYSLRSMEHELITRAWKATSLKSGSFFFSVVKICKHWLVEEQ